MCLQKAYSKQERNRGECQKKVHLGSPWNAVLGSLAMSGGGVDWLGLLGLAIIIGVAWVIASRKR